ncbi:MAG: hypothetical protein ABSG33_09630 [Candidatus Bathyarchaeia archaeon]|jgi:threonine/homoserine/homoserine lactone efflux protein
MAKLKPTERAFGLRLVFHSIGLSSLAGAVFLQFLVFLSISKYGAFMGIEKNPVILNSEIGLTVFSAVYLLYLSFSSLRSLLSPRKDAKRKRPN